MLAAGFVDALRRLRARGDLQPTLPSMRCVGYRQAWAMLAGEMPTTELRDRGIFATRQFAKRQITWLRATPGVTALDSLDGDATDQALRAIAALAR